MVRTMVPPQPLGSRELRVIHVVNAFAYGGAETFVDALSRHMRASAVATGICAVGSVGAEAERPIRERLAAADIATFSLVEDGPQSPIVRGIRLHRVLRDWHANVVHLHTLSPATFGILGLNAVAVQTIHAGWLLPPRRWLKWATEATLARLVQCNIAVSRSLVATAARRTGLSPSALTIIPNGIEVDRFACAMAPKAGIAHWLGRERAPAETVALILGRIDPNKGHDIVIDAAHHLRRRGLRFSFLFGGASDADPSWTAALQARLERYGLADSIRFLGVVEAVPELMKSVDLLVSASRSESLSLTVLEALAAGCPAVVSDIPVHREITEEGQLATLFRSGDAYALADACQAALTRTTREPRASVLDERYSIGRCTARHLSLYRQLLQLR